MVRSQKTLRLTQIAIFGAIVAVLQIIAYVIPTPMISISLVMIPVVLGGVYFGPKYGAVLGGVFGLVVTVFTVTGFDKGAYILFAARPFVTVILCFAKGILAGLCSALVFRAVSSKNRINAIILAAATAPIINTGIFCAFMFLVYRETLNAWAGGTNVLVYILTGLVGINFIVEFLTTTILCPAIGSRLKI